jgi:hypothetical protein
VSLTVAEYMEMRCICGAPRREHAHAYDDARLPGDIWNPHPVKLRVIGNCQAFTWELERELTGNPLENKHLRPLMVEGD